MIIHAAHDGEVAAFRVFEAEAIAAARGGERMGLLRFATVLCDALVESVDCSGLPRVKRDPAAGGCVSGLMDGEDVVVASRASKPAGIRCAFDDRQVPNR